MTENLYYDGEGEIPEIDVQVIKDKTTGKFGFEVSGDNERAVNNYVKTWTPGNFPGIEFCRKATK